MNAKPKKSWTAQELVSLIKGKYSGSAYVVLEQVANGTGSGTGSWVDAAAFSLWPSQGIWRAAFEVKISRADFIHELKTPNKNQWARECFDFFWYVVAPGVVKDDEIPSGCGLMVARGNGLSIVKHAPRRENVVTDETIIASFARSLDKERERFKREGLREAVEQSYDYRKAMIWKEGAERYIKECGDHCYPDEAKDVYEKLREIVGKKTPEGAAVQNARIVLDRFQGEMLDFLLRIAPLCAHALDARDEASDFLVRAYGLADAESLEALRAALKKKGTKKYQREKLKRTIATREEIAACGAEARE